MNGFKLGGFLFYRSLINHSSVEGRNKLTHAAAASNSMSPSYADLSKSSVRLLGFIKGSKGGRAELRRRRLIRSKMTLPRRPVLLALALYNWPFSDPLLFVEVSILSAPGSCSVWAMAFSSFFPARTTETQPAYFGQLWEH